MRKTLARTLENRDMWRRLFGDCNLKQREEIENFSRSIRIDQNDCRFTCRKRFTWAIADEAPDKMRAESDNRCDAQTESGRVTIPDPSDTLGDPIFVKTMRQLVEAAGRIVAKKNVPGSGVIAPYGTIDDICKKISSIVRYLQIIDIC